MRIIVAEDVGFCFGVKRAVERVKELLLRGEKVYTDGDIVHNPLVMKELEELGLRKIDGIPKDSKNSIFVVRAHGLPPHKLSYYREHFKEIIDLTCPIVKNLFKRAADASKKGKVVVFGKKDHPEMMALSGYVPDGRVLIDYSREICQTHRLIYDEYASVEYVARRVSDIKQAFTQQAGVRPFGVSIIFGGIDIDKVPRIFVTDPSGSYVKYYVAAIGNKSDSALNFLSKHYSQETDLEKAKILAAAAIKRVSLSDKQLKIRFLEVPIKTMKAKLYTIKDSCAYLEKATEVYG